VFSEIYKHFYSQKLYASSTVAALSVCLSVFSQRVVIIQGGPKNVALCFCWYLCQLLFDFQNFFTDALCRQFAI